MYASHAVTAFLLPLSSDDLEHRVGVRSLFEGLTEICFVEQLGDIGQRVQVFLKLALRYKEEHYQVDRLIIQGIEADAFLGSTQ